MRRKKRATERDFGSATALHNQLGGRVSKEHRPEAEQGRRTVCPIPVREFLTAIGQGGKLSNKYVVEKIKEVRAQTLKDANSPFRS